MRNKINIQMRKTKAEFYHREIGECAKLSDLKKTWSLINSLTGKNNKSNSITEISVNNRNISNSKLIAEAFNEYFVNIGPNLASEANDELPEEEMNNNYIPNPQINAEFQFHQITVENVALALMNLKTNKSTGLDKIPAKVLKVTADIIAPSLSYIFNLSLETGIYVDDWKRARVNPIYKSDDKLKCENYRPISILPIVSKVFEREVFRQIYSFVSDNSLLSKFQSGFRPKHSTLSSLIQMCDDLLENMDNGKINCVVFLDVRKAFDCINHEILLKKMLNYFAISGIPLNWFKSYLTDREQQCLVNGHLSSPRKIKCGVPQGSILGPLLFLMYINDMPDCLKYSIPSLYADDTEIYLSSKNCDDIVIKINLDLENIRKWMLRNKLQIHPTKSKYMFIGSAYNIKHKLSANPIFINNVPMPRTENYICLGVNIDERLTWEKHIDMICSKVSAGIGAIRRIRPFVSPATLKLIYNAIVQPYFDYCSPLWDNCGIGLRDRLQKFQNRAARVISGATYDVRSVDLIESLGWKHLELRRNYLKSVFMYKILNNHTAPNLRTSFRLNNECENTYDLRNRETDLSLPKPNTDSGKRCFKYNGAVVWNNLPYEAKVAGSLSCFQRIINQANT